MNKLIKIALVLSCLLVCNLNPQLFAQDKEARLAEAQKNLEEATREYAELATELSGESTNHIVRSFAFTNDSAQANKARLGINIGEVNIRESVNGKLQQSESKIDGVKVLGVSPEGPAEKAGLHSGDVITTLNDQLLLDSGEKSALNQLTDIMSDVNPGETVKLTYQRDGVSKNVNLVTDEMPKSKFKMKHGDKGFNFDGDIDISSIDGLKVLEGLGDVFNNSEFIFITKSPLGNAELVELSPDLGEYFGAKSGLLVVKASSGDIDLRDGDVILSIDGREANTVGHAMRILRSYEAGEDVKLDILRKKRKRKLTLTIPETSTTSNSQHWKFDQKLHEDSPTKMKKHIKIINEKETT